MTRSTENPTAKQARHRPWTVTAPLAAAALVVLGTAFNAALFGAYLVAGRHLLLGTGMDGRLTTASLPEVTSGQVPPVETVPLTDLPASLRWLCAAPTLIFATTLLLAVVLVVVAVRGLASAGTGTPWVLLAAVLVVGGLTQGAVDTAAVQALRAQYHPFIVFGSPVTTAVFAVPWLTVACGLLAAATDAALRARSVRQSPS
ncbi:hypothetical protein AS188_03040 [Kocuria flava]|uniref:DUF2567 domain-containing protein n=1 Tax=Kocuria flava TaxID=446860 RepID=A0A0U3G1P2_9MICC|nr:hypothetical protein [Kocuria flava]ALU38890.1 hypothetical protein AS188_03040 [Kocuria flava]GEO91071.1 hypothetical protein KFL01_03770 [Kocuria flava]